MEISINYFNKDKIWCKLVLKPENYFDMDYCLLEEIDEDSVSKYDHAINYIDEYLQPFIIATELKVNNKKTGMLRHITTSYWHNQTQAFIERRDFCNGKITYHEFILSIEIEDSVSTKCSVIRIIHENDSVISKPVYHGIFTRLSDGSEVEQELDVWGK
jgi:hypothetical protein